LRYYAASLKVSGSRPHDLIEILSIDLILQAALGPEVLSGYNGNEYRTQKSNMFLESRVRLVREAGSFTAIY
jgi:hypothetical protein